MWSGLTRLAVIVLLLSLTACKTHVIKPIAPERCPAIPDPGRTYDELERWSARMVDLYNACAVKVDSLHDK